MALPGSATMYLRYAPPLSLFATVTSVAMLALAMHTEIATRNQLATLTQEIRQLHTVNQSLKVFENNDAARSARQRRTVGVSASARRIAANKAQRIFRAALSKGVLTRNEVLQMRRLKLTADGGPAFDKLTLQIFQALNARKLVAQDPAMVMP